MLKLHQKSITFSQQGFAIIPLLILIVLGITAGVYLTQSGTSFLPKAVDDVVRIKYDYSCDAGGDYRLLQVTQGGKILHSEQVSCNNQYSVSRPCVDDMKLVCGRFNNMQCIKDNDYEAHCAPRTENPSGPITECFVESGQIKNPPKSACSQEGQTYLISHCDTGALKIIGHQDCLNTQFPANYKYYCYWNKQCSGSQQSPAQPAAPTAQTTQPGVAGDCPAGRQLSCSSGEVCKLDHVGTRWCTDPNKKEGDSCGTNCIIIGGLKKAPYPDNTPETGCNPNDKAVCTDANNEECAVFKKNITVSGTAKDVWYSACRKKTGTAPAAGGPAAATAPRSGAGAPAAAPASTNPDLTKPTLLGSITQKMRDEAVAGAKEKTGALAKAQRAFSRSQENAGASIDQASVLFADTYIIESIRDALKKPDWSPGTKNIIDQAKKDGLTDAQINKIVNDGVNALNQLRKNEPKITASSLQSFTSSTTTAAAPSKLTIDPNTAVNCGLDKDSINIPCYQIGVFADYDTLTATEAQASIATQRYLKSQEILDAVKGKVDDAIFAAAQDKLNKAKEKAAACMKQ